jgi:hypothetical protein
MKNIKKILLGTLILAGLQFGLDGGRGGFGEVHPGGFRR